MFDGPNSLKGLRKRAERLEDCPYKLILQLAADQIENNIITEREAKKAIKYARTHNSDLLSVAMKMLQLSQEQISTTLRLLEKMK